MFKSILPSVYCAVVVTVGISGHFATPCIAAGSAYVEGTTIRVTVEWSSGTPPVHNSDFFVDFSDQSNPDIELTEGDLEWRVESKLKSNNNPANIGSLTTPDTEHYGVKIAKANGDPGAAGLGSAVLVPASSHHSSILAGSRISGDLGGNLTVVRIGGSGGEIAGLTIEGNVSSSSTITVPVLTSLTVNGGLRGTIDNTGSAGALTVNGSITSTAQINLGQLDSSTIYLGSGDPEVFAGDLVLSDHIDAGSTVRTDSDITNTAVIDLKGYTVAGYLALRADTISGQIIDVGIVSGAVELGYGSGGEFNGTATFDAVADDGRIYSQAEGGINGTVHILGDVDGELSGGGPGPDGNFQIDGDVGATGFVSTSWVEGDVKIGGNLDSGGYVEVYSLEDTGRVLIDGQCSGLVQVNNTLSSNALIRAIGGLPSSGVIHINSYGTSADPTEGTIHIGATSTGTPLPSVPFDGLICINAQWKAGTMRYTGCDNDTTAPNVCAVGGSSATYSFTQTGCTYTVPTTPNCVSSCP